MKKFTLLALGILALLILAVIIIPFLVPSSVYKSAIQDQLSARLERDVKIQGDVKISPLPSLKIKVGAVDIKNPPGFSKEYFAQMEGLDVRVRLIPLISKKVEISAFELNRPIIELEKTADGSANWIIGDQTVSLTEEAAGPFKRDGRFADLNVSLGTFKIQDGSINYIDAASERAHQLTEVNLKLSMASLDDKLTADGDLIVDDIPADIKLSLDTPRSFLNGAKTPVDMTLGTLFGDISAKGYFTESQDIHFAFDVIGSIKDLNPLIRFFPTPTDYSELADTIDFSGNYSFDGQKIDAKGADIKISGPVINSQFSGDAFLSDIFGGNGQVKIDIQDYQKLTRILQLDTPVNDTLQKVELSSAIKLDGETVLAENLKTNLEGAGLDIEFTGQGKFGDQTKLDGQFSSLINSIPELAQRLNLEQPQLAALGNGMASGTIRFDGANTWVKLDQAKTEGPNLSASYMGDIIVSDGGIRLNGRFDSKVPNISQLSQAAATDIPYANAVGGATAKGDVSGSPENLVLNNLDIQLNDGSVSGSFQGSAEFDSQTGFDLDGSFNGLIPELSRVAETSGQDIPYAQSVKRIETSGKIKGKINRLSLESMQIKLSDGELNGLFDGGATIENGFKLDGQLQAEIPSARRLTRTTTGVELPASTEVGEIYEKVAISGKVSGNPAGLHFSNADLTMDAINGDGEFHLDLTTQKPKLKGTLDMGTVDFRPYMAAYAAGSEGIQPWSEVPYNFTALNLMDGNYIIKTPEMIFGPLTFGQTDLDAVVKDGVMTARLPEVNLYGGLGVMTATLDASGDIPKFKLAVTLEDITSNRFLSSLANFTQLEGTGHTLMEITGQGRSQAEIMRSLNGYGNFEVIGGVIKGIDLSKFLTGVDESLTQRVLPQGIGAKYATNFNDLVGKFKIKDGVITLDNFNLKASGVHAGGSGILDIGNQRVDFGLRPRLTNANASDLGRFGVPIRFKGNWGNISPGPDFDLLQEIAVEKAKLKASEEITDRVGDEIGGVLGGILGIPQQDTSDGVVLEEVETPANSETQDNQDTDPKEPSQMSNDPTSSNDKSDEPPTAEAENASENNDATEKPIEQELIEGALQGLFGKKKEPANQE